MEQQFCVWLWGIHTVFAHLEQGLYVCFGGASGNYAWLDSCAVLGFKKKMLLNFHVVRVYMHNVFLHILHHLSVRCGCIGVLGVTLCGLGKDSTFHYRNHFLIVSPC